LPHKPRHFVVITSPNNSWNRRQPRQRRRPPAPLTVYDPVLVDIDLHQLDRLDNTILLDAVRQFAQRVIGEGATRLVGVWRDGGKAHLAQLQSGSVSGAAFRYK
jgi:hypothetical protein